MNKLILLCLIVVLIVNKSEAKTFKEDEVFAKLNKYISLQENELAWRNARSLEEEYLGDIEFDFLYGVIALRVNEEERAVYAFERVISNRPNWLDAQYYLAISYFKIKNYHAVIDLLNSLEKVDKLSDTLRTSVDKLKQHTLTLLNKQSLFINHASNFYLGYDSNVNAGTSEDKIFLPLVGEEIFLSEGSREISDNYLSLDYQIQGSKALTQSSKITFSGMGQLHHFTDEPDYNRVVVNASVAYQKEFENFTASMGIRITPLWLNDSYYRTQYGTNLGLSKKIIERWSISADSYIGQTKNDVNELLNTDDKSIQVALQYSQNTWQHALSLGYSQEISKRSISNHNDRKINNITYSAYWSFAQNWLANAAFTYQKQAYQHEHPFYFEKRTDDMWLFGTSIQYQNNKMWSYRLSANIQDKDSNLSLFSYQRTDISLSARLNF